MTYGLTTEEALTKLKDIIEDEVNRHVQSQNKFNLIWNTICSNDVIPVTWPGIFALFCVLVVIIISGAFDEQYRLTSLVLEVIVLIALITLLITCCVRETYLKENEVARLILKVTTSINDQSSWDFGMYPILSLPQSNSVSLVWTYRNQRIVNLPWNLLVEGDVVVLGPSRVAPAECRQISSCNKSYPLVTLDAGDMFNPVSENDGSCQPHPRERFEVLQAPIKSIIKSYLLKSQKKQTSIFNKDVSLIINIIECRLLWVVFCVSLLVNILRWELIPQTVGSYIEMLLLIQAYTILPLLPLTFPLLWLFVTFYGTARLRTLFNMYIKFDVLSQDADEIALEHVDCNATLFSFWDVVCGDPHGIPRTVNLLHTLGTITTFCCVDKEGILCYADPIPEKIFVFKNHQKVKRSKEVSNLLECDSIEFIDNGDEGTNETVEAALSSINDAEILSMSADPKNKYGIQFDDIDWKDQLPSLKPLGVNMLLNSPCLFPMKALRDDDFVGHLSLAGNNSVITNFRGCMCSLAKQIGFQDCVSQMYRIKQQLLSYRQLNSTDSSLPSNFFLSIVKDKHVPCMVSSLINETRNGISQLLTQGSADLVLDACTDVWNGDELCTLNDNDRKKALNFFQRMNITRNCVAFAYRPIFEDDKRIEDAFIEYPASVTNMESDDETSDRVKLKKTAFWMKKTKKDLKCEDLLKPVTASTANAKNLHKQIFLGMVTLTHSLKEDLVSMVEQLNSGGIRFVHFSYENELLSRVFCQRLGLETGWNCHISLGESSGATLGDECSSSALSDMCPLLHEEEHELLNRHSRKYDTDTPVSLGKAVQHEDDEASNQYENYDELYFMSNRSKLPKGIQNMRTHLEVIDDVPLLVPLFTDCTPLAVSEMMCIMQEYDEIVCCIGSLLNANNHHIFIQSDLSIALEPLFHQTCIQQHTNHPYEYEAANTSVSDPNMYENGLKQGPLLLSGVLNSITCSLTCSRRDNFPIAALVCEARRLTTGFKSCFLFLLSCHLSLALVMLISSFMLLPPPLTGLQIVWLMSVVIPLLSLSLIGTPADPELMKTITGKRKKYNSNLKEFLSPYVYQFFTTFGLNSLFIVVVMLPWLLYTFCNGMNTARSNNCHWILGARNVSAPWHGLHGSLKSAYFITQDIILLYITFTYSALSISFVHRTHLLWRKLPFNNKPWCMCVIASVSVQLLYTLCSVMYWKGERSKVDLKFNISPFFYVACIIWLFILLAISELQKRKYIRNYVRFQKRERLKFDTKLGMNSPV